MTLGSCICDKHSTAYRLVESLYYTPETSVTLSTIVQLKKRRRKKRNSKGYFRAGGGYPVKDKVGNSDFIKESVFRVHWMVKKFAGWSGQDATQSLGKHKHHSRAQKREG